MGILGTIAGAFGGQIVDSLLGNVTGLFKAYFDKKITEAELRAGVLKALMQSFADVEKAYAESVAKTFGSFMEAAAKSRLLQVYLVAVGGSQLLVLLWHQVGIPFVIFMGWAKTYPSSGATVDWAYAIVIFTIGGGSYAFRSAGGGIAEKIGALFGKKV